jgi:hypothetical protein
MASDQVTAPMGGKDGGRDGSYQQLLDLCMRLYCVEQRSLLMSTYAHGWVLCTPTITHHA